MSVESDLTCRNSTVFARVVLAESRPVDSSRRRDEFSVYASFSVLLLGKWYSSYHGLEGKGGRHGCFIHRSLRFTRFQRRYNKRTSVLPSIRTVPLLDSF